jgi:hypothetical protein
MHPGGVARLRVPGETDLGVSQAALARAETARARESAQTSATRASRWARTRLSGSTVSRRPKRRQRRHRWRPRHRFQIRHRLEQAPWDRWAHDRSSPSIPRVPVKIGSGRLARQPTGSKALPLDAADVPSPAAGPRHRSPAPSGAHSAPRCDRAKRRSFARGSRRAGPGSRCPWPKSGSAERAPRCPGRPGSLPALESAGRRWSLRAPPWSGSERTPRRPTA